MDRQRPQAPRIFLLLTIAVIFILYLPIAVMFLNSLLDHGVWTFRWYQAVFVDTYLHESLINTLIVAASSSAISLLLGVGASIAIGKGLFSLRKSLEAFTFLALGLPELVMALSLLTLFYLLRISSSLLTVTLAHITFTVSFVILTVHSRTITLEKYIDEAAMDLGASEWQILRTIILPLLKPACISALLLGLLLSFDDFLITFYTIGVGTDTLPIKLYSEMRFGLTPKLSALSTLMFICTVLLSITMLRTGVIKNIVKK
ncbi:MAG: hypothetical protein A2Z20_05000 [Bdellovibrionales bacterium RBG_16_40_8]|nr:MAG: hypothetical protein A2Z20_05000 [Bdellovibrionales bacterium RBG_16_40_8]